MSYKIYFTLTSCLCQPLINGFGIFCLQLRKCKIQGVTHGTLYHALLLLFGK